MNKTFLSAIVFSGDLALWYGGNYSFYINIHINSQVNVSDVAFHFKPNHLSVALVTMELSDTKVRNHD